MGLAFLVDENLRGSLADTLVRVALQNGLELDVLQVGDFSAPPHGTKDPELLLWAEDDDRILLTFDVRSLPKHLADHLASGHHSPGILAVSRTRSLIEVAEFLVVLAFASDPSEWRDQIRHVPH